MSRELRKGKEVNSLNGADVCNAEELVKAMAPGNVKAVTTIMGKDKQLIISTIAPSNKKKINKKIKASDEDPALVTEIKNNLLYTAPTLDLHIKMLSFLRDHDTERIFTNTSGEAAALHVNVMPNKHTPIHLMLNKF